MGQGVEIGVARFPVQALLDARFVLRGPSLLQGSP